MKAIIGNRKTIPATTQVWGIYCPPCGHRFNVYHLDWTAIVCPSCKTELEQ